ncbi:MAG: DUF5666 domain-containing protein [Acidimicrobiales bacterium]
MTPQLPPSPRPQWRARRLLARGGVMALVALGAAACSSGSTVSTKPVSATGHHAAATSRVSGAVIAVTPTEVTLRVKKGTREAIALTAATIYRRGNASASLSDVAVGERARVGLEAGAPRPTAKTVTILSTPLVGTVTAVDSSGFSLRSAHGTLHSVTTSPATTYRQAKATVAASALHVGERVRVLGSSGPGGSMTAKTVDILAAG